MIYEPSKGKTAPSTTTLPGPSRGYTAFLEYLGIKSPASETTQTTEKIEVFTETIPRSLLKALAKVIEPLDDRIAPLREFLQEIAAQVRIKLHLPSGDEGARLILGGTGHDSADDAFQKIANWGNFYPVCRKDGIHFRPIPAPVYDVDHYLPSAANPSPDPLDVLGEIMNEVQFHRETASERPDFALLPPELVVRDLWDFICQMGNGFPKLFDHGMLHFARMEYAHHLLSDTNYLPLMKDVRRVVETAGFCIPEKRDNLWIGDYDSFCELSAETRSELYRLSRVYWDLDKNETRLDRSVMRYVALHREQLLVRKPTK